MYIMRFQNSGTQTIAAGGNINLGSSYRLFEKENCAGTTYAFNGNALTLSEAGIYDVDIILEISAPAAGDITIAFAEDGVVIPFTEFTETITTATTEFRTITISYSPLVDYVTRLCKKAVDISNISIVNTGAAPITVTNLVGKATKVVY